jgi:hypothetical protein
MLPFIKLGFCDEFIKNGEILFNNKTFIVVGVYTCNENGTNGKYK